METLKVGDLTIHWLNGGVTHMDGGAMFGVVPKPLWSKKYAVNDLNQIELRTDPLFFKWEGKNVLIESGMGKGKLNDKQKRNYGVKEESDIEASLAALGLTTDDIDVILMTHMHFDHACGLTKFEDGKAVSVFPNAVIHTSRIEWDEMRNPNVRSRNTYWKENWEGIQSQVETFEGEKEVLPGITMVHTGGHSDGHSIIHFECNGENFIHMADLMPTHAHKNPLWVLAYDDYPMTSIGAKEKWITQAIDQEAWFLFYHDAKYRGIKWNRDGEVVDSVLRERE
ncbi:YtnP family quorum-quenching lactonase [Bacillus sp. KH172YL63]|uniref:YtnP family quorum-quenching lactonase n=1 Tax=Bacillus sp. KH172YL63 TaxID=2709784 RepID=UPI0013E4E286|nr:MBL fold metallo-hydrolase [Bacillus sp. KH172YL63]BCB05317.1 putative quorum-quenching lactonase YtnP [Bacillus sp. KH172YL63]